MAAAAVVSGRASLPGAPADRPTGRAAAWRRAGADNGGRFNDKERSAEVTHSGSRGDCDWRVNGTTGGNRAQR